MSLININFYSTALRRNTQISVMLPCPEDGSCGKHSPPAYPVLYLLHGSFADYTCWQRYTMTEKYASALGIAVVMPDGANSFYHDMAHGDRYNSYISSELPAFIRRTLPVLRDREHTFIGGLSMGGYGALKIGLQSPQQYGKILAISAAVETGEIVRQKLLSDESFHFADIFGEGREGIDLSAAAGACGASLPQIYSMIGKDDFLYGVNKIFNQKMLKRGVPMKYEEWDGAHDWVFWDSAMKKGLAWLAL